MNLLKRFLFLSLAVVISTTIAKVPSCRAFKAGMTTCDPYTTSFFKISVLKRGVAQLRHQPITKKSIPITEKIRVKHGITLNSLISKYIKREEKLYDKVEEKRREEQRPLIESAEETVVEPTPSIKTAFSVHSVEKTEKKFPLEKESAPAVIKKRSLAEENQSIIGKSVLLSKTMVLTSPASEPLHLPSSPEEERDPSSIRTVDVIHPVTRLSDIYEKGVEEKVPSQKQEIFARYVVKKGDSLQRIAKRFWVDVATLVKLNDLKRESFLKVGQKLRIPLSQELTDTLDNAFYIVKKGDTLSHIAKRFRVKLSDLKKYNKIRKKSIIHIGQGLVIPVPHKLAQLKRIEAEKKKERLRKKRARERLARIALKKEKRARFLKASKGLKRKLSVIATAYTSHRGQTDSTPFLAAWNNRIRPGMKIIAVSRDLIYKYGITNGSKVRISGLPGIYTVRDKMHRKWRKKIDIYMGTSRWRALRWGRRRVTLYY